MNEFLKRLRTFYHAYRTTILSGLTVLSVLLIVWARMGFTIQISRFFANEGETVPTDETGGGGTQSCPAYSSCDGDNLVHHFTDCTSEENTHCNFGCSVTSNTTAQCNSPTVTPTPTSTETPPPSGGGNGGGNQTPTPTPTASSESSGGGTTQATVVAHTASVLTVQCGATQNVLTWTLPAGHDSNGLQRSVDGGSLVFLPISSDTQTSYTDTNISAGHTYAYRHKPFTDTPSNTVLCPLPTPSPTATPTPSSTATPTPTPTATPTATPTPTPTTAFIPLPVLDMLIGGVNASTGGAESSIVQAHGGQQLEVLLHVRNAQPGGAFNNVVTRASLPPGLVYVSNSTAVNGVPAGVDSVATSGLALGTLGPQQEAVVTFRVNVVTAQFVVGTTQVTISAVADATDSPERSGSLAVVVMRAASGRTGTVNTGPGDAVVVALLISSIMTLLYVTYTHTAAFKKREVDTIIHGRDPMDFRS